MNHKIIRTALALFFVSVIVVTAPRAQQPAPVAAAQSPEDRIALYQALLDLTNPWTVMCIAAHPDDEDGTSLIVMRRKYGAHTVSLFSTFGEGGQNAIGPELYEELGAIRARETMAAAEIQGSEPHFLGLKDFGYSKSADEAFKFWGHEEALRRMVLQIRKLRPDVIITNHSVTNKDHGHHQATARLELEAFDAAADPARFPEQLKDGVTVWQVQRLFVRARGNAQAQADNSPIVTIDPNEQDPVRGVVYAEEALRALQKHATQGPWPKTLAQMATRFANSSDGRLPIVRYRLVREAKGAEAVPKDSHNVLDGLRLPESFAKDADVPLIDGKPLVEFTNDRSKVTEALIKHAAKGYRFASDWSNSERLALMQDRIDRATALASGVVLQVDASSMIVTPDSNLNLKIKISNTGSQTLYGLDCGSEFPSFREPVEPSRSSGATSVLTTWNELRGGAALTKDMTVRIPEKASINVPLASHLYEPSALGLQLVIRCSVGFGAVRLISGFNLTSATALNVAPLIEIDDITPSPVILTKEIQTSLPNALSSKANRPHSITFKARIVSNQTAPFKGEVVARTVEGEQLQVSRLEIPARGSSTIEFNVAPQFRLSGFGQVQRQLVSSPTVIVVIGPSGPVTSKSVPLVLANAKVAQNLRVGYVRGFDYSLPNALNALGVESKELSVDEVKTADLQKYTSIIVDNRVYESQPELIAANQRLLDYAKDGGTLIVFYHKSNEWNPDERRKRPQLAPYKLILGDERITDETAPITFIEPDHPLLNFPNKMGQEDFANWIQERGLYYPKDWDAQYHALLQSNDPGEAPLKGGLLVADYGRGHYIYTSMVWYRELRGGVPGAYRMLANMISYGRAK
jgi:LmbE family N-acetylglucosaminyl deacetylase